MVFGGVDNTWHSLLSTNNFDQLPSITGVTAGVFNPNGWDVWLGTGGPDATNHVGIRLYSNYFPYVATNVAERERAPSLWGSSVDSPNADISSMALVENYILVGLRAKKGNPKSGGLVVFDIYQSNRVVNDKPFLSGLHLRNVVVGDFTHGDRLTGTKKRVIMLATDTGLFEAKLKMDLRTSKLSITTTPVDRDSHGNAVSLKEIDHLFQRDERSLWFSLNNQIFVVTVN